MAWRIVKQPNGLLARWSEVVDDFTHYDMTEAEAVAYCEKHMSRGDAIAKVRRGVQDEPIPGFLESSGKNDGLDRFRDCITTIHAVHGTREALAREKELAAQPSLDDAE